ncbi:MAG: tetratricopeptide repeat protein [Candidatus Hodarchaeota archaeon]
MPSKALKDLFEQGRDQEVLAQIAQMEAQGVFASLTENRQLRYLYYKSRSLERLMQFEEALQVVLTARTQYGSPDDTILSLMLLIAHLYALQRLRRLDEALTIMEEGNVILDFLTAEEQQAGAAWIALFENVKGLIYHAKGDLDTALDYFQRSLTLYERLDNHSDIFGPLGNICSYYLAKDDLDTALKYIHQGVALEKSINNQYILASFLTSAGLFYWLKEDWDIALDYYQRSLSNYEAINNRPGIAWGLFTVGTAYRHKGELETALNYWKRSYTVYEKLDDGKNPHIAISSYFPLSGIVLFSLELQDLVQAQKYLPKLQKLYKRTQDKQIHYVSRLGEALILKQGKRMKDKVQAQVILQQLINEENTWFAFARIAIVNLCELLLIEVKSFGDREVWEEVKTLTQQLHVTAQEYHSFSMIVETLLLQAKMATIDGDLQQALKYYEQARLTAEEKKLGLQSQKVNAEQKRFEMELEKWQTLIQRNASLQERLAQSQLDDYIQQVQKLVTQMKD